MTIKRDLVRINSSLGGSTTTFAYPSSTTTTEKDGAGHVSTYTLDTSGRVTAVTNALGKTKSQTWTAYSDIATAIDALGTTPSAGNTTRFSYDSSNNLIAVAIPTGTAAKAQYTNSTTPGATCTSSDTSHPFQAKCVEDGQGDRSSLTSANRRFVRVVMSNRNQVITVGLVVATMCVLGWLVSVRCQWTLAAAIGLILGLVVRGCAGCAQDLDAMTIQRHETQSFSHDLPPIVKRCV